MKVMRILQVPKEVTQRAETEVRRINYYMDFICRASNHPGDNHLFYVIGHKAHALNESDGYACWLYNHSTGCLQNGHYGISDGRALQTISANLNLIERRV